MPIPITWHVEPIVNYQLTGRCGRVEADFASGRYEIDVYSDRMEARRGGRSIPVNHTPMSLQRSASSLRATFKA